MKAFSFDLEGELAIFKKNDANDLLNVSYNFIHKPCILGIMGAIIGLPGYIGKDIIPEYYKRFADTQIAICPLYSKPLKKVVTGFNNASGLGSREQGSWMIKEQILVGEPIIGFRIFIIDDESESINKLKKFLMKNFTEYPLYFGKNEFFAYYKNYNEYESAKNNKKNDIINSLIKINKDSQGNGKKSKIGFSDFNIFNFSKIKSYTVYEYLPISVNEKGFYIKELFIYSGDNLELKELNIYTLTNKKGEKYNVQFI